MQRRGAILVVVLFVLTVLSLIALSLSYRTGLETRSARGRAVDIQLHALNHSAVAVALSELAANTSGFTHPAQVWHSHPPLSDGDWLPELAPDSGRPDDSPAFQTSYEVLDEEGKLNVLYASSDMLKTLGLGQSQIDGLYDWLDADNIARSEGAKSAEYRQLSTPYNAKNGPTQVLDELLLIHGITPAIYYGHHLTAQNTFPDVAVDARTDAPQTGLVDLLTCVSDGRINLNTAPEVVLHTLPVSAQAVDQIIGYRSFDADSAGKLVDHAFRSPDDIDRLQGLTDADRDVLRHVSKFSSQYYRIFVNSKHVPTGRRAHLEVLVRVTAKGPEIIKWR